MINLEAHEAALRAIEAARAHFWPVRVGPRFASLAALMGGLA